MHEQRMSCLTLTWILSFATVSQASVESWNVSFLDVDGIEVATASFSYDTATTAVIDPLPPPATFNGEAAFSTVFGLDAFESQFYGVALGLGGEAWWRDPVEGMGMLVGNRSPLPTRWDGWFLGDPFEGIGGQIDMQSDNTWTGYVFSDTVPFQSGSGTWQASIVPCPGSCGLLSSGLLVFPFALRFVARRSPRTH